MEDKPEEKYPFRFDDVEVGDTVYFVHSNGVRETVIEEKTDFAEEIENGLGDKAIKYWVKCYPTHALRFGESLFLTEDEANRVYENTHHVTLYTLPEEERVDNSE